MYNLRYGSALTALWCRVFSVWALILAVVPAAEAAPKAETWDMWQQTAEPSQLPVDTAFAEFLARYRSENKEGVAVIDYASVTPESLLRLKAFVGSYIAIDPRGLSKPEQFVYWVNIYNAQIIVQILDAGIPESIRDIRPGLAGLLAGGPWKKTQFRVAGQAISFNDIEHRILRPLWRDPRVHFVLNCASIGCPNIPSQPLAPDGLEDQLDVATKTFINHSRAVSVDGATLKLSSLFDWFADDFGANEAERIAFINRYRAQPIVHYKTVNYAYDWALNAP